MVEDPSSSNHSCLPEPVGNHTTVFGQTDVPEWEAVLTVITLTFIILLTIIGNVLVILSVFTYKPLRIVQNFFIVSLAVADLTVAILVLPLNVMYSVLGRWIFGIHICKMWLTSDILCCTASILNLCAIALDRFWAITDPINYAQKRTLTRVLLMIGGVWVLSLLISSPPLIGWNDWPEPEEFLIAQECKLTERQGYVIYSSSGSFYIPLFIMITVYLKIFTATRRRLRERAQASKINAISKNQTMLCNNKEVQHDRDSVSSETNHNEHPEDNGSAAAKDKKKHKNKKKKKATKATQQNNSGNRHLKPVLVHEDSITDNNADTSSANAACTSEPNNKMAAGSPQSKTSNNTKTVVISAEPTATVIGAKKPGMVYQFIEEKQRISLSKERRAARTLGIIMGVFVVCWLPFFLMYVIVPFCARCCPTKKLINFITWLGYINSALNPIIYTIFNLDFRRAFRKLLGMRP